MRTIKLKMLGVVVLFTFSSAMLAFADNQFSWFTWPSPYPDTILHNAVVLTMEPDQPVLQAIAIKDGKIIAVGKNASILKMKGSATELLDLNGLTVMPGLVDAHTHLFNSFTEEIPNIAAAQTVANRYGITTLGNLFANEALINKLRAYEHKLTVRTSLYMNKTDNCGVIDSDWYLNYPPTRTPGEALRIGGIKIFTDGDSCGAPAVSQERIPGRGLGDLFHPDQQVITDMVSAAHQAGYQVAIHAIGDRGIEQALNAIEAALDGGPNSLRHRIEHNGVLRADLIPRFGELDVVPTIFGYKRTCWLPSELPMFYQNAENAYRTLIEQNPGLQVAWHGDDPAVEPINPFIDLFSLVTRIDVISQDTPCLPPQWLADQALTVDQALTAMTMGAAYALDREQEVGSLRKGKYADLIVISANPHQVAPDELKEIEVLATMVHGRFVYQAEYFGVPPYSNGLKIQ